jgi:hypothetical protein
MEMLSREFVVSNVEIVQSMQMLSGELIVSKLIVSELAMYGTTELIVRGERVATSVIGQPPDIAGNSVSTAKPVTNKTVTTNAPVGADGMTSKIATSQSPTCKSATAKARTC